MKKLKISLQQPCEESWDKMTPSGYGRYCDSCSRIVTDFTKMSDREIVSFFKNNSFKTCGQWNPEQLEKEYNIPVLPDTSFFRRLIQLSLSVLLFSRCTDEKKPSTPREVVLNSALKNSFQPKPFVQKAVEIPERVIYEEPEPLIRAKELVQENTTEKDAFGNPIQRKEDPMPSEGFVREYSYGGISVATYHYPSPQNNLLRKGIRFPHFFRKVTAFQRKYITQSRLAKFIRTKKWELASKIKKH